MKITNILKGATCSEETSREQYVTLWYPKATNSVQTGTNNAASYYRHLQPHVPSGMLLYLIFVKNISSLWYSVPTGRLIALSDNYRSPLAVGLFWCTDVAHKFDQHVRWSSGTKLQTVVRRMHCLLPKQSAVLVYFAAEAWNHRQAVFVW